MSETTPTGIPIEDCGVCDHRHPVTRNHCSNCGLAHIFPCKATPRRACLITCISLDDEGRACWCERCPERVTPPGVDQ